MNDCAFMTCQSSHITWTLQPFWQKTLGGAVFANFLTVKMVKGSPSCKVAAPKAKATAGAARVGKGNPPATAAYYKSAVRKILREQFRDFDSIQIVGTVREERTLWQRLLFDKQQWYEQTRYGRSIRYSTDYYQSLRHLYSVETSVLSRLRWDQDVPENHEVDPGLRNAEEAWKQQRPNRAPLFQWVKTCKRMTEREPGERASAVYLSFLCLGCFLDLRGICPAAVSRARAPH